MGPRSGSPATETLRAKAVLFRRAATSGGAAAFLFLSLGLIAPVGWAATVETSHQVTVVVVPTSLSVADDTGSSSSLKFNDPAVGSQSSSQTVNYRVSGNSFPSGALSGVVSVSMVNPPEGIELKADVGAFTNNGTDGDILLRQFASGEQVIGTDPTPLADKEATSGTQANILNGTLPVTWTAGAKQDLPSGKYPVTLTVTLKDT